MPRSPLGRRGKVAALGVGVAGALAVATLSNSWFAHTLVDGMSDGVARAKTVAAMLADRSPGARPDGALANLKPKRQALLHERALPKVRPPNPAYEALAGPPPTPPIVTLPSAPLYTGVAGAPIVPAMGGTTGGSPLLSEIPAPGAGGGIFAPPVSQATPVSPPVPVTPVTPQTPVPEPATWTTMILGFLLLGNALSRRGKTGTELAVQ